jgi:hypothetical protein
MAAAILVRHNRTAHISGLWGDASSLRILGMKKLISEDALRHSLSSMTAEQSLDYAPIPEKRAGFTKHCVDRSCGHA